MRNLRIPAFLVAAAISGFSAVFASTHVHTLGVAPVLGVSSSTPELRKKFAEHPEMVREAARQIGLSKAEYSAFITKFNNEKPGWGTIPRHLDAMAWAAGGHVYAIHDVIIPAGVNGWEVDLHKSRELVKIYIPMICGNLSVVRVPVRQVSAVRPPLPAPYVAPPAPAPVPLVAAEVPPPAQQIPPVAPAVRHPKLFWPIAAAVVAGVLIASNHHHDSGPSQVPPVVSGGSSTIPGSSGGGMIGVITPPHNGGGCACSSH